MFIMVKVGALDREILCKCWLSSAVLPNNSKRMGVVVVSEIYIPLLRCACDVLKWRFLLK